MNHPHVSQPYLRAQAGDTISLRRLDGAEVAHVFEGPSILAVNAALAAERPLLVRGEPGTGKSQLAHAVAAALGRVFVSETIDGRTESRDLFWSVDSVARLAEAQLVGAAGLGEEEARRRLDERRFVTPGPLWWAFDWGEATRWVGEQKREPPPQLEGARAENGAVVLLDEIDKADASVPNGLLEALGSGRFPAPAGQPAIHRRGPAPLVVITTNEERSLPDAFLRRCLVLPLKVLEGEELHRWLTSRGRAHFGDAASPKLLDRAATLLAEDRQRCLDAGLSAPGQAEYLDLLRAVLRLREGDEEGQLALLETIAPFALEKHGRRART